MTNPTPFWTEYEAASRRCRCACGARFTARDDADADRWLAEHTVAHQALLAAGVVA